jgi:signal peptidase I
MLKILRVEGDSLQPLFEEGDFVLVSKIPFLFTNLHSGDVIAFRHPVHGTLIKLIEKIDVGSKLISVVGTHPYSVDSRQFGPIHLSSVLGKVILRIPKPRSEKTGSG